MIRTNKEKSQLLDVLIGNYNKQNICLSDLLAEGCIWHLVQQTNVSWHYKGQLFILLSSTQSLKALSTTFLYIGFQSTVFDFLWIILKSAGVLLPWDLLEVKGGCMCFFFLRHPHTEPGVFLETSDPCYSVFNTCQLFRCTTEDLNYYLKLIALLWNCFSNKCWLREIIFFNT